MTAMIYKLLPATLVILQLVISRLSTSHAFSSPTRATTGGVDTDARKRTGKKSFLQRQSRDNLPRVATLEELSALATSLSKRRRGSNSYYKGWIHWRTLALDAVRQDLSMNLPHAANISRFENLFFQLGVASDLGRMPSFEDAGARSGYAMEFFCRARNLADLYVDALNPSYEFPEGWVDALTDGPILGGSGDVGGGNGCGAGQDQWRFELPNTANGDEEAYSMVSLGGGPGFDYVGAALATTFCSYTTLSNEEESDPAGVFTPEIKATILDYEEGWGDLVHAMGNSTRRTLQNPGLRCEWGGKCDIGKPILDPSNAAVLALVSSTNLWTCQYCVAENAELLRASKYVFFADLFERARVGSVFVLSEVHPRLWPDFCSLIEGRCLDMSVGFNKNGRQMLLRKCWSDGDGGEKNHGGMLISDRDRVLVQKFAELGRYHERKIRSGWRRQERKRRGGGA